MDVMDSGLPVRSAGNALETPVSSNIPTILNALSPFDYLTYAASIYHDHQGVYNALLEGELYNQWLEARPWRLRCHGAPRSGKSTFAAAVACDIQARQGFMGLQVFLEITDRSASFDLTHQPETPVQEAFTRTILRQIIERKLLLEEKSVLLENVKLERLDVSKLSQESLNDFIALETVDLKGLFVVIDGHAEEDILTDLHDHVNAIANTRFGVLSMEDSSRFPDWIRASCDHCEERNDIEVYWCCKDCPEEEVETQYFCIDCYKTGKCRANELHSLHEPYKYRTMSLTSNNDAMEKYIIDKLEAERKHKTFLGLQLTKNDIEDLAQRIINTAQGNFVLARLNTEHLIEHQSLTDVVGTFSRLPHFEVEYFHGLMQRIAEGKHKEIAFKAILLSMYAIRDARTFTIDELNGALCFALGSTVPLVTKETIGQITNGILNMSGRADNEISLFHQDIETYLDEECEDVWEDLDCDVALLCMKQVDGFLTEQNTTAKDARSVLIAFLSSPFTMYAWEFWGVHLLASPTKNAQTAALNMLRILDHLNRPVRQALYLIKSIGTDDEDETHDRPYGTALHVCAHFGLVDLAKQYQEEIESDTIWRQMLDAPDRITGATPLLVAVAHDQLDFVQFLLASGASADVHDIYDHCPLSQAMERLREQTDPMDDTTSTEEIVTLLTEKLSDNAINTHILSNHTLLMLAVEQGHENIVDALLRHHNLDLSVVDTRGRNVLHVAVDNGHIEILQKIVDQHSESVKAIVQDKDAAGRTLVMALLQSKTEEELMHSALQLLTTNGADLSSTDTLGHTVLHYAVSSGASQATMTKLHELGADIEATNHEDRTALHLASAYGSAEQVSVLIDIGADQQRKDSLGYSALDIAKQQQYVEVFEILAPEETLQPEEDFTKHPIWRQISYDAQRFVDAQEQDGAQTNAESWQQSDMLGWTALHWAVNRANYDAVRIALQNEYIEVNKKSTEGQTALHMAAAAIIDGDQCWEQHLTITRELLLTDDRIDIDATNAVGLTALEHALAVISRSGPGQTTDRCWEVILAIAEKAQDLSLPRHQAQRLYREAVLRNRHDLLERLIAAGASPLRCRLPFRPMPADETDEPDCIQIAHRLSDAALLEIP